MPQVNQVFTSSSSLRDIFINLCLQMQKKTYIYIYINPSCIHHDTFILPSQTIEALSAVPSPELALRLYLQCAEVCHGLL